MSMQLSSPVSDEIMTNSLKCFESQLSEDTSRANDAFSSAVKRKIRAGLFAGTVLLGGLASQPVLNVQAKVPEYDISISIDQVGGDPESQRLPEQMIVNERDLQNDIIGNLYEFGSTERRTSHTGIFREDGSELLYSSRLGAVWVLPFKTEKGGETLYSISFIKINREEYFGRLPYTDELARKLDETDIMCGLKAELVGDQIELLIQQSTSRDGIDAGASNVLAVAGFIDSPSFSVIDAIPSYKGVSVDRN